MKILIFSPYYPPHIGGLESHADEFNKHLSFKGLAITVFTPNLPKNSPDFETRHNDVRIIRFPAFEIVSNYPLPKIWSLKFWKLFANLFDAKPDIVISRTRFFSTSLLALVYAKMRNVRWIHIEHGSDFVSLSSKFKTFIARIYDYTFGSLVFKFSNLNVSISRAVQKFVREFDRRDSPVIYRGLDFAAIENVSPASEMKKKYANKTIVSFVGRLYRWKGVENSIMAIKALPQELKEKVIFLIVGDGEDFERLKKLAQDEKCIHFLGNQTRETAIEILKITDIYVHSAYSGGGLSTSLLEAMCCGCAVIATPNEGADEIINSEDDGILIKKSGAMEISAEMIRLINDEYLRKRLGQRSRTSVSRRFMWNQAVEAYLDIFKTLKK